MSSTRMKNSIHNYALEHTKNISVCENRISPLRNYAYDNALPDAGILTGHMPGNALDVNSVDIESQLRGIGLSDMTTNRKQIKQNTYNRQNIAFFEKPDVFLPEPLVVRKNQRPIIP